jgi:hypothetical protein
VLWDRVALVRRELVVLADELESADIVDPRTMIEIQHAHVAVLAGVCRLRARRSPSWCATPMGSRRAPERLT